MKTTRAYIASFGTTGVLVASSLFLLFVVSALIAFNGWPGSGLLDELEDLIAGEEQPPAVLSGPAAAAARATPAAAGVARAPTPGTPAAAAAGAGGPGPAGPAPSGVGGGALLPGLPGGALGGGDAAGIAVPAGVGGADGLPTADLAVTAADLARELANTGGEEVSRVSPPLGGAVEDTGEDISEILGTEPLPEVVVDEEGSDLAITDPDVLDALDQGGSDVLDPGVADVLDGLTGLLP